ncbi:MAG: alkaline phosphatase family protein [Pseudomonadota bacterium]
MLATILFSLSAQAQQQGPRVVLLGIDAAGWAQLSGFIDTKLAPSITALADQGVLGKLTGYPGGQVEQWQTIATGNRPAVNEPSVWWARNQSNGLSGRRIASAFRAAPGIPIWQRLEQNGLKAGISGWPVGVGSSHATYTAWFHAHGRRLPPGASESQLLAARSAPNWVATTYAEQDTRLIQPEAFRQELEPLVDAVEARSDESWFARVPVLADLHGRSRTQYLDIKFALVAAEISAAIARQLIEDRTLDLVAVNLWGLDPILHRSQQLDIPLLEQQAWRYFDTVVGSLVGQLNRQDYLFLVSNHSVAKERNHNFYATDPILVARGPGIRSGGIIEGATIADIAPTLLRIFGFAAPHPADGRVMDGLFTNTHWERQPPARQLRQSATNADAYRPQAIQTKAIERATLQRMRDIGYFLEPSGP